MAAGSVRLGIAMVPGLASSPRGETNTARPASPSMPSQLVSRNIRSGASASIALHSQPLAAMRSRSTKPAAQVSAQLPITQAAVWFIPAVQRVPHVPQFIGSVW